MNPTIVYGGRGGGNRLPYLACDNAYVAEEALVRTISTQDLTVSTVNRVSEKPEGAT